MSEIIYACECCGKVLEADSPTALLLSQFKQRAEAAERLAAMQAEELGRLKGKIEHLENELAASHDEIGTLEHKLMGII